MKTRSLLMSLSFSCIAGTLIIFLLATAPSNHLLLSFEEKVGTAMLFILCCAIGILFTFHPNWLRWNVPKSQIEEPTMSQQGKRTFKGHHPACNLFENHTIQLKGKIWCAGCLGILIGLCIAILFMILYIAIDIQLTKIMTLTIALLGLFILAIVYFETLYQSRYVQSHVVINSLLPLGFFMITIAVAQGTGNVVYGLFTILLCFLWLDTRIHLSKWHHRSLCTQCPESCKMFTVYG